MQQLYSYMGQMFESISNTKSDLVFSELTESNQGWKKFTYKVQPPGSPFWTRSAFGQYTHSIFTFCEEKNSEFCRLSQSEHYNLNPFYSKDFADYLRTYFLPYAPMISHMIYAATGVDYESDTNNPIESYFGVLK